MSSTPRQSAIYILTSPSNKHYVGQTVNLSNRLRCYRKCKCKHQPKIYSAILKYGWENFKVQVIPCAEHLLDQVEIQMIAAYDSIENGYNIKGGGTNGRPSAETVEKIASQLRGRKYSEEHRRNISKGQMGRTCYWKGKKMTRATKDKMSKSQTGRKATPETRALLSKLQKARGPSKLIGRKRGPMSEEQKKKLSIANKGKFVGIRYNSPEWKAKYGDTVEHPMTTYVTTFQNGFPAFCGNLTETAEHFNMKRRTLWKILHNKRHTNFTPYQFICV